MTALPSEPPHVDRDSFRRRTLKGGRIELSNHASTFDVTIRDMSLSGALLVLKDVWVPPEYFGLLVANTNSSQSQRHACQKVWQKGTLLGVRFLP